MTSAGQPTIEALLAAARAQYAESLGAKGANLVALIAKADWNETRRAAHKLRGSAATYGFVAFGGHAGALEELLIEVGGNPDAGARARIAQIEMDLSAEAVRAIGEMAP